jgi:uncharacterized protein
MPPHVKPDHLLGAAEARALVLRAQGLARRRGDGDVAAALNNLGAVQIDTISVLARSHELVMYSRLGAVERVAIEAAYWQQPAGSTFEYWAHCACILPIASWPYFEWRRAEHRAAKKTDGLSRKVVAEVRARLADGPVTVTDVGGARRTKGSVWWDPSEAKTALDLMWWTGEVVCARRQSWKRVYDLPERAVPAPLRKHTPDPLDCYVHLVDVAVRALGVATRHDIANYHQMRVRDVDLALAEADGLVPVTVDGWEDIAWAARDRLADLAVGPAPERTTLLSPFDSLIWERKRMKRLFGVVVLLEAYVPQAKRVNGYFAMPVLSGDRLIGHVDPQRDGTTLVIKQLTLFDPAAVPELAGALREAAQWVGADTVVVERAEPRSVLSKLRSALR